MRKIVLTMIIMCLIMGMSVKAEVLFKFNEGIGTSTTDESGEYVGTLVGTADWQTDEGTSLNMNRCHKALHEELHEVIERP